MSRGSYSGRVSCLGDDELRVTSRREGVTHGRGGADGVDSSLSEKGFGKWKFRNAFAKT